jgi:hypothetical protein
VSTVAGILLAYGALRSLGGALPQLGEALIAWREVRPLFEARAAGSRSAAPEQVANRASDAFCAFVSGNQLDLGCGSRIVYYNLLSGMLLMPKGVVVPRTDG